MSLSDALYDKLLNLTDYKSTPHPYCRVVISLLRLCIGTLAGFCQKNAMRRSHTDVLLHNLSSCVR